LALCETGRVANLFSTDAQEVFLSTATKNIGSHFPSLRHISIVCDARILTGNDIQKRIGKKIDVLVGGPPCDDFTIFGLRRGENGPKAMLIFEYSRLVRELRPQGFLFENVPNLTRMFLPLFERLLEELRAAGYSVEWRILRACDYGSPTMRERVIVIGIKNSDMRICFKPATHCKIEKQEELFSDEPPRCNFTLVRDVLAGMPDAGTLEQTGLYNHTGRTHRPQTIAHLRTVPQGVAIKQSYRYRAPWDSLCRSLTAGLDDSTKSYIHPWYDREMSVREYARLHGFPDSWIFMGTHHNGIKQVANAVPLPLGRAAVETLLLSLGVI